MSAKPGIKITGWCSRCEHGLERHDEGVCSLCGHQCWGMPMVLVSEEEWPRLYSTSPVSVAITSDFS